MMDLAGISVFIVGKPASGKSYLSSVLAKNNPKHILIRTDDYIKKEWAAREALMACVSVGQQFIVEGMAGYTLLGEIASELWPDMIIELIVDDAIVASRYLAERDINKLGMAMSFYKYRKELFDRFIINNSTRFTIKDVQDDLIRYY